MDSEKKKTCCARISERGQGTVHVVRLLVEGAGKQSRRAAQNKKKEAKIIREMAAAALNLVRLEKQN